MVDSLKARIARQPYFLFLLSAVLLFVLSFAFWGQTFDVHLHDTYFIIATPHFIWGLALLFLFGWAIYQLMSRVLWTKYLTWFHVVVSVFLLVLLLTLNWWHDTLFPPIERGNSSWETIQEDQQRERWVYLPLVLLFLASQLAFIVNLFGGLIKKVVQKS
jgi:uncharacterized membrane protein YhaH (DUF805 family)